MPYFIYALCEPTDKTVRYIGKTANIQQRMYNHCRKNNPLPVGRWAAELRNRNLAPAVSVLHEVDDEWLASSLERKEIARHRAAVGDALLNFWRTPAPAAEVIGKHPTPLSFADVEPLFDCNLAKWPSAISPGETYTVPMDTDDRNRVYQRFHRAGQRWQVEFDVRVIGKAAMFRVEGKPSRRIA